MPVNEKVRPLPSVPVFVIALMVTAEPDAKKSTVSKPFRSVPPPTKDLLVWPAMNTSLWVLPMTFWMLA